MEMLTIVAAQNPDRAAIVEGEKTLTYAKLNERIVSLSVNLYAMGTRRGDQIALLFPNGADFDFYRSAVHVWRYGENQLRPSAESFFTTALHYCKRADAGCTESAI